MPDALLVAAQHVNESFLAPASTGLFDQVQNRIRTQSLPTYGPTALVQAHEGYSAPNLPGKLPGLARSVPNGTRDQQFRQEINWLAANKHRYAGRWIALEGDHLLAVGATSREVFAQLRDCDSPPLVIRIEENDLSFAGW